MQGKFPVDALNIDQSFVRQLGEAGDDATIVTAVIGMARGLKLRVVAGGVETAGEPALLRAHQCDEAQGHYFSLPVLPQQFARLLRSGIYRSMLQPYPATIAPCSTALVMMRPKVASQRA
jgi:EAL domain-containing protein (putative c-di-GMP-specific phosphodiesterase class I)